MTQVTIDPAVSVVSHQREDLIARLFLMVEIISSGEGGGGNKVIQSIIIIEEVKLIK